MDRRGRLVRGLDHGDFHALLFPPLHHVGIGCRGQDARGGIPAINMGHRPSAFPKNAIHVAKTAQAYGSGATGDDISDLDNHTVEHNSLIAIGAPTASRIVDKCEADSDEG
eukprot:COSAG02_NODE_18174_length_955_cov_2.825935_1_plen_111_part_00